MIRISRDDSSLSLAPSPFISKIVIDLILTLTHTIFDVVPAPTYLNSTQTLLYILILAIGIPILSLLFVLVTNFI